MFLNRRSICTSLLSLFMLLGISIPSYAIISNDAPTDPLISQDKSLTQTQDEDILNIHFQDFEKLKTFFPALEMPSMDQSDLMVLGNIVPFEHKYLSFLFHITPTDSTIPTDANKAKQFLKELKLDQLGAYNTADGKSLVVSEGLVSADKLIDAANMLRSVAEGSWKNWIIFMSGRYRNEKNDPLLIRTDINSDATSFFGQLDTNAIDLKNNTMLGQYPVAGMGEPLFQVKISHLLNHIMNWRIARPNTLDDMFKNAEKAGVSKDLLAHLTELVGLDIGTSPLQVSKMRFPSLTLTFWNIDPAYMYLIEQALSINKDIVFKESTDPFPLNKMYIATNLPLPFWVGFKDKTFYASFSDPNKVRSDLHLDDTHINSMTVKGGSVGTRPYTIGLSLYPQSLSSFLINLFKRPEGSLLMSYAAANGISELEDVLSLCKDPLFSAFKQVEAIFTGPGIVNWKVRFK